VVAAYANAFGVVLLAFANTLAILQGIPRWGQVSIFAAPLLLVLVSHTIPTVVEQRQKARLVEIGGNLKLGYCQLSPQADEEVSDPASV